MRSSCTAVRALPFAVKFHENNVFGTTGCAFHFTPRTLFNQICFCRYTEKSCACTRLLKNSLCSLPNTGLLKFFALTDPQLISEKCRLKLFLQKIQNRVSLQKEFKKRTFKYKCIITHLSVKSKYADDIFIMFVSSSTPVTRYLPNRAAYGIIS